MARGWRPSWWPRNHGFDDAPIAVCLPEPLVSELQPLLADGRDTKAVRLVRRRTHLGQLPAVFAVDAIKDLGRPSE